MEYGIASLSIIPARAEPADASEMVTQLLFGEHYEVLEGRKKWLRIRTAADRYECWIDRKQHQAIDQKFFERLQKQPFIALSNEVAGIVGKNGSEELLPIVLGSQLPFLEENVLKLGKENYRFEGAVVTKKAKNKAEAIVQTAFMYLNAPYLWGGRSPFGIDCSGLSQLCYKMAGVQLPRDSYQQAQLGHALSFIEEAEPGDLAFFDNAEGKIIHVGILLQNNHIIHASGKVRIDRIDHQGIYNNETRDYSHRLRIIKRMV